MNELLCSPGNEAELRGIASLYRYDNYCEGDEGFCEPARAVWRYEETLDVSLFLHLMEQRAEGWREWFSDELQMDEDDELGRNWKILLDEPNRECVVVLIRDGKGYIWDGWHRTAAAIAAGRTTVRAIVGRPL